MYRLLLVLLLCQVLAACESASWAGQAARGQLTLLNARKPLDKVIGSAATAQALRVQLQLVRDLRAFSREALAMEGTRGFDSYVATGREFVVWNVIASGEFSVAARRWCFPIAGCVNYRGYFRRAAAERFAATLAARGFDTYVYGVAAYSTLGWFDDPVLDTWAMRREPALAALLFHEFAHQLAYAPDDTEFSESFARVVEREGVRRWLAQRGQGTAFADYLRAQRVETQLDMLLGRTRVQLEELYRLPLGPAVMRERKALVFDALRAEYRRLRITWPDETRFDAWMSGPLDNARLASVANYQRWVVALDRLLEDEANDLPAFYAAARQLVALTPDERVARLLALEGAAATDSGRTITQW